MPGGLVEPEERIAETFNRTFTDFEIRIEAGDALVGTRREIRKQGRWIAFRVLADDAGFPSLEFYATHRMTNDRHARIWADGHLEERDAIHESFAYDPKVPGSEDAARDEYLRHNRMIAEELRAAGLYPEGNVNAYLRTGGGEDDEGVEGLLGRMEVTLSRPFDTADLHLTSRARSTGPGCGRAPAAARCSQPQ